MSEKQSPMYSRFSHPHAGDPRVDPEARRDKPAQERVDLPPASQRRRGLGDQTQRLHEGAIQMFPSEAATYSSAEVQVSGDSKNPPKDKEPRVDDHPRITATIETIKKGKKGERIILNIDGKDIIHTGRVYGLKPGTVIRSAPAETRDSLILLIAKHNHIFFAIRGEDTVNNGLLWHHGFALVNNGLGMLPTYLVRGVVNLDSQRERKTPG